ncbi:MAG: 3-oxoacyl-[acyl-carrier-protein] reductase [Lachnospiraceae bacterium]
MLSGKIALVTGASRGIGRQTAITLAAYGATVIVNYNGSKEKAEEVVDEIQAKGGTAAVYGCNVSDYSAVETMMKELVAEYGRIDILVNNAGITKDGLLMKMSEEDYDAVLDINLKGTFNCIKHISRQMLKQKAGRIINLSSVVGVYGNAGQVNYSASKAGVIGITKSVAKEIGSRGVTVNAVAPGFIITEMTDAMPEDAKKQVADKIAMKKLGETKDVAELVAFLASDKAAYITGQVICVDGGMSI